MERAVKNWSVNREGAGAPTGLQAHIAFHLSGVRRGLDSIEGHDLRPALFARHRKLSDLRYDFQGLPERSYDDICKLLHASLSDAGKRFTYSPPAIKEVIVSGDLAVVRLTWTLKVHSEGTPSDVTSEEIGLDVFRRQPDGRWKIIRYIAFEAP